MLKEMVCLSTPGNVLDGSNQYLEYWGPTYLSCNATKEPVDLLQAMEGLSKYVRVVKEEGKLFQNDISKSQEVIIGIGLRDAHEANLYLI